MHEGFVKYLISISCTVLLFVSSGWAADNAQLTKQADSTREPVITCLLGSHLFYYQKEKDRSDERLTKVIAELKGKGISISWEASPAGSLRGVSENPGLLKFLSKQAKLLHENGIANAFALNWYSLLPANEEGELKSQFLGVVLNPETSKFECPSNDKAVWDFGNEKAREFFALRANKLFKAVGPREMFCIDEVTIGSTGKSPYPSNISTYWTSPTYSLESLKSFRKYLRKKGYPNADNAKFPVTTESMKADGYRSVGLPAIKIDDSNRDRLQADNNWPNSNLWSYWYDWREDLFTSWVDTITTEAVKIWGNLPDWQGCAVSYPEHWYTPALGTNLNKLAALPNVDYLVAGYYSGGRYAKVKEAALRHGKKWGGMIEWFHYGNKDGVDPDVILKTFYDQVDAGASFMLLYPGTIFRKDYPSDGPNADRGLAYSPTHIEVWRKCVEWLENGRKYKRIIKK